MKTIILTPPMQICPECNGEGQVIISCCGDDISHQDIDLCPSCHEHCGHEPETCDECNGIGVISAKNN